jgi:hypothetical protein
MKNDLLIEKFGGRTICFGGIGKMFYQEGFPISMAVSELNKKGVEVSILHVADECLKNGWSAKTTYNKLKAYFEDDIDGNSKNIDWQKLEHFCNLSNDPYFKNGGYEEQREMIFQYLFGLSTDDVRNIINKLHVN